MARGSSQHRNNVRNNAMRMHQHSKQHSRISDWSMKESFVLVLLFGGVLGMVGYNNSSFGELFDFYGSPSLTGMQVAALYEGHVVVSSQAGVDLAKAKASEFPIQLDVKEESGLPTVIIVGLNKDDVLEATQQAAEVADKAGLLVSFTVIKK